MLDLVIRGGHLVDGTGTPGRAADVAIQDGRVVGVGSYASAGARLVLDATGLTVVPGFIDPHSHSDWTVHANPEAESTIKQGVTTEVVGNCGLTNAPVTPANEGSVRQRLAAFGYSEQLSWTSFSSYLADVETRGTSQNLAWFVGHSTLREAAAVDGTDVTTEQLSAMASMLDDAMDAGALGLSSGLEYGAGRLARSAEVTYLASVAGRRGGYYASHVRNRDASILAAIDEFLGIVKDANVPGQISHLNVRQNTGAPEHAWERAVALMSDARAAGVDVQADTTPFNEGIGLMTGILPDWLMAGGPAHAALALTDRSVRDRVRHDCDRYWRFIHRGEWSRVRLQNSSQFPELAGMTFPDIATSLGIDEWDAYFDLLAAAGEGMTSLVMVGRLFDDSHLAEMISHPMFSLGVDQYSLATTGPLAASIKNPMAFCGHVHYLTHHVRQLHTLSLEEAVRKMTSMPAQRYELTGRGLVREGYWADVAVLDFEGIRDVASFEDPTRCAEGVRHVVVNGAVVVRDGIHTGRRAGRVLRRA